MTEDGLHGNKKQWEGKTVQYTAGYHSPLGDILLAADDRGLTGLWFEGAKYFAAGLGPECEEKDIPFCSRPDGGLTSISPAVSRTLCRRSMREVLLFVRRSGRFYAGFLMERR